MVVLVGKREVFDVDMMYALAKSDKIPVQVKNQLRAYRKRAVDGNTVHITYDYGKEWRSLQRGRISPEPYLGLAVFPREVRAVLSQKYYWDLDIENAQPVILSQFAKKHNLETPALTKYCENRDAILGEIMKNHNLTRDEAKNICIATLFGGIRNQHPLLPKIHAELTSLAASLVSTNQDLFNQCSKICAKKDGNKNPLASMLAVLAQDEEKKILDEIDEFISSKGRSLDVLIYDGGQVLKLENETCFPDEVLKETQEFVLTQTGYNLILKIKPLTHTFSFLEDKLIPSSVLINDAYAAEKFATVCGDKLTKIRGTVWGFNSKIGLWEQNLHPLIDEYKTELIFCQESQSGVLKHDYGGCVKKINYLLTLLPNFVEDKDLSVDTSKGKLLFADGIYDFDTQTFTKGFDPKIVFKNRINRPFPTQRDFTIEAKVNKLLFQDPYLTEQQEQAQFFKTAIARAIYGDYLAKRFYISVGSPNCGRGLLTIALQKTFEGFIATFNSNSLLFNPKSSEDDEKKNSWLLALSDARLAISNEVSMTKQFIDGNKLKSASSGGDILRGRFNHKDAIDFVVRATLLLLTNDIPAIKPADEGLLNRICVNELKKTYKQNPQVGNQYEAQEDKSLKEVFDQEEYQNALFWILADDYTAFSATDKKAPKPASVITAISDWVETGTTIKSLLEDNYSITKNPDDFVPARELIAFLKGKGCMDSETKIGRELGKLGLSGNVKKLGGLPKRVWIGVKTLENSEFFN